MRKAIIWINGALGAGKTTVAFELQKRLPDSFVYDPENMGFFLRNNTPASCATSDFQDIPLWREANYEILRMISRQFDGTIIVPMTIVNPQYFDEIITRLTENNIRVDHYILSANKKTLMKRLRLRLATFFRKDTFALRSIDRCLYAFDHYITEEKVETNNRDITSIVEEIATRSELDLLDDTRSRPKKLLDRSLVLLRHIR